MVFEGLTVQQQRSLRKRMRHMDVSEKDIVEQFVRASGRGGQNVNKVSSCVRLLHIPTGISVKCEDERSQGINRYKARCQLLDLIEDKRLKEEQARKAEIAKKRRQNRKLSVSAKEQMLADKHYQSEKKKARQKIREDNEEG